MKLQPFLCIACAALACAPIPLAHAQSPAPAVQPAPPPLRKLPPVDEGSIDPTWVQFRTTLLESLQRGDRRTLAGVIDPDVLNALEAPRGIIEFRRMWDLDGTDNRLLHDLSVSLQMGSAWYRPKNKARMLCAPYVPIKWPLDDVDPYDSGAIVVKEALVKDAPSHAAQTLGRLSYDIIAVLDWEVADREARLQQRWVKVRFADRDGGRDGYVPAEHIRSAIEHRACFARSAAGWRLVEYVLGIEYLGGVD